MAERRMFALKIIDSDAFLDMPTSSQNLYFHLSMRADDDGFISSPRKVMRMINASDDDMKILLSKRFLLAFESGIVVVKHWRIHNYISKDRYTETIYKEEKESLYTKENGAYTDCIQDVDKVCTQVRLVKVSEGKDSINKSAPKVAPLKFQKPTLQNVIDYCQSRNNSVDANKFIDHYESVGWKVGRNPMKDWQASVRTWEKNDFKTSGAKDAPYKFNPKDFNL